MKKYLGIILLCVSLTLFGIGVYTNNQDIELPCLLFGYVFGFASMPINLHYLINNL